MRFGRWEVTKAYAGGAPVSWQVADMSSEPPEVARIYDPDHSGLQLAVQEAAERHKEDEAAAPSTRAPTGNDPLSQDELRRMARILNAGSDEERNVNGWVRRLLLKAEELEAQLHGRASGGADDE